MRHFLTGIGLVGWAIGGMALRLTAFDQFVLRAMGNMDQWRAEHVGRAAIASAVPFCGVILAAMGVWLVVRAKRADPGDDPRLPRWARFAVLVCLIPFALAYVHADFARVFGISNSLVGLVTMVAISLSCTVLWAVLVFRRGGAPVEG